MKKENIFKHLDKWGESTYASNILETKPNCFCNEKGNSHCTLIFAKDINGDWHNGYFFRQFDTNFVPADYRNPKMFLSLGKLKKNQVLKTNN